MNENENFKIHVNINGFKIPLNVVRKDEEIYRKAEKLVEKYLDEFHKTYSLRSSEEILTLVAFRLAVALSKLEINQDLVPLVEKIKDFDSELKQLLSK